jgi:asparagine synthase (glutamine-hydrolysing)
MCGITGVVAFNQIGKFSLVNLEKATMAMSQRGPDDHGTYHDDFVGLGHRRLAIIDTSSKGHQPMQIPEGRYVISFNGEIFNYKELRQELIGKGFKFYSETDTEVILRLYELEGKNCLQKLNGFFALAIYDTKEKSVLIARDRMGIKPLLYFQDDDKLLFASEMKAMMKYGSDWQIDKDALNSYFQLNYIPAPLSILKGVKKLLPGHLIEINGRTVNIEKYYDIPESDTNPNNNSYEENCKEVIKLLDESVQKRMIADVPLGSFLSGGIDSSIITALASRHTANFNTFSIGFKDNAFFDETAYAKLVADKFKTNHTVFSLDVDDLYSHIDGIVDYIDEPFADSSAILVNILTKETRKHMTVALSGDGADEIFSGYNKHAAWMKSEQGSLTNNAISALHPIASFLPKSRSGFLSNKLRQVEKFGRGLKMNPADRYWFWASISSESEVNNLLKTDWHASDTLQDCKYDWLEPMNNYKDFNDFLRTDTGLVLPNDMLQKVDLMSMSNSLEVRVPFLDHKVVEFAFSLSPDQKINDKMRKRILQDAFRDILPAELYNRPKKGFEVPLLDWLRKGLRSQLDKHVFNEAYLQEQNIFNVQTIMKLKSKLLSFNPGDSHSKVWALFVFQKWYKNYFENQANN